MIALIDYGAGNTASVANALEELKVDYKITQNEAVIMNAEKVIFPGVGEASYAIRKLHFLNLYSVLRMIKKPLLGICLGMQLLGNRSEEGDVSCLGLIPFESKKFDPKLNKVPHMGWANVTKTSDTPILDGIRNDEFFYFAHSYYVPVNPYTLAKTAYNTEFSAVVQKEYYYGVQFHPEKSGEAGLRVLNNFIEKC
jgi:glutamine amidotransferase